MTSTDGRFEEYLHDKNHQIMDLEAENYADLTSTGGGFEENLHDRTDENHQIMYLKA